MTLKQDRKQQINAGLERIARDREFSIVDILGGEAWNCLRDTEKKTIARDFCELVRNSPSSFPRIETVNYPMKGDQLYRFRQGD